MIQLTENQFYHKFPTKPAEHTYWQNLNGSSIGLAIAKTIGSLRKPIIIIVPDTFTHMTLQAELDFFLKHDPVLNNLLIFPDLETLPYDNFSPHEDIIAQRLLTLYKMRTLPQPILLVNASSLMQRLAPHSYIEQNSFVLSTTDTIDILKLSKNMAECGYYRVNTVMSHGEFAIRGSIIDIFPSGSLLPFRIDLFDDEVDSIRTFDPETQLSIKKLDSIQILPAKEYPLTNAAINLFKQSWHTKFAGNYTNSTLYANISSGKSYPGIEYYLPLFFSTTNTLFDYLPTNSLVITIGDIEASAKNYWQELNTRYDQLRHDVSRPILSPKDLFVLVDNLFAEINRYPQLVINPETYKQNIKTQPGYVKFNTQKLPDISCDNQASKPLEKLQQLIGTPNTSTLFVAESAGRVEALIRTLKSIDVVPIEFSTWHDFLTTSSTQLKQNAHLGITIAPLEHGLHLPAQANTEGIFIVTENQLYGQQVMQRRMRKTTAVDSQNIINNLTELQIDDPVVHIDHGIGRYLGLQNLNIGDQNGEFLVIMYANEAKLYVPVTSLHLISRYTGVDSANTPLHSLGSKQWEKAKREAREKIHDVAAEILTIHATRHASKKSHQINVPDDYQRFAAQFPFELTPDQERATNEIIQDMSAEQCMDRVICGDVGFGKTEVAMRAAFLAVNASTQVAVLAPTTILANQHLQNFQNRFAGWPIKIDMISRFRSTKEQQTIFQNLKTGNVDIIIGTHGLLKKHNQFKRLGLLIIDEEHRFGVKQKEHIQSAQPNIDVLTLTATPIPRTLNMALASIRSFSIIATPPAKRLSIKTYVHEREPLLMKEAISRELFRGGQVYFLHNDVATIAKTAAEIQALIPEARIAIAHGQMPEQQLENIMRDFYHLRYNILLCTTIIESGIDVPTANTIIIDRADRLGLAQLHQLRGRVGRSHHQAYAYLLTPPTASITADAKKRLYAITSMEDLGAGFNLAIHDLEIRGAGEILGAEQSGQIQSIGFSLYMELLEKAVKLLKEGKPLDLDIEDAKPLEINLQIPALFPEDYIYDISLRLVLYKRLADAKTSTDLGALEVEVIDRFGPLPKSALNLFQLALLRLKAEKTGIKKITAGSTKGCIEFTAEPDINPQKLIQLIQQEARTYKLKGQDKLEFILPETIADMAKQKLYFVSELLDKIAR